MTVERTLARVDDDLRRGDVTMAGTRLRSLVRDVPRSLEARLRLAEVCRLEGLPVEAGRWSYLAAHREAAEVQAFERACGDDPVRIMRALRWRGPEDDVRDDVARERLREVRARAEAAAGRTLDWADRGRADGPPWWQEAAGPLGCALVGLVLVALVVVGAVTVVGWVRQAVAP